VKCVFCGGKLEEKRVIFIYEEDDKHLLVENVPAYVCTKCGEKTKRYLGILEFKI